jgi:hypothetical protein
MSTNAQALDEIRFPGDPPGYSRARNERGTDHYLKLSD